jgi:His-Xaa-Ser system radical SAM maturase HxsC
VPIQREAFLLPTELRYLTTGDIVRIDPARERLTTLFRVASTSNSLLVTERCDNRCIMCSQPPIESDDEWILDEVKRMVPLIPPETREIGITGGEPALLGQKLVDLINMLKLRLPKTAVHLLTNGRHFANDAFARTLGDIRHPDLMVGVPLHSDLPEEHDYIAQRSGAFDEAVRGILNLKRAGLRVEIRFVIHAENCRRLAEFADFVTRNLVFVDHIALMGLEPVGFARLNCNAIWVDPVEYQADLLRAVNRLSRTGSNVSIYNLPLCLLPPELHLFARKSISDWKCVYPPKCDPCSRRDQCCGFFASADICQGRSPGSVLD